MHEIACRDPVETCLEDVGMLGEQALGQRRRVLMPVEDLEGAGLDPRAPVLQAELVEALEPPAPLSSLRLALVDRDEAAVLRRTEARVRPRDVDDALLVAAPKPVERVDR